jgi:single-stranded DNA-binding protein
MAQGGEHQGDLGADVHAHAVMPNDGTDLLPDDVAPSQSEPTPHAPTGAVGGELSPLATLDKHERSEEDSSDPGRNSSSCFDYSVLEHGCTDATKNDAFESIDGDADEPPDAA